MIINFKTMDETHNLQFRGGEGEFITKAFTDNLGKIMYGKLGPGSSIGMHAHETNSEIVYILKGQAHILFDNETEEATAGDCHYCPKGHAHSIINSGSEDLEIFAVLPEQ